MGSDPVFFFSSKPVPFPSGIDNLQRSVVHQRRPEIALVFFPAFWRHVKKHRWSKLVDPFPADILDGRTLAVRLRQHERPHLCDILKILCSMVMRWIATPALRSFSKRFTAGE